jgi:photosystem II stability/assembly factor-like uncharacterized protein
VHHTRHVAFVGIALTWLAAAPAHVPAQSAVEVTAQQSGTTQRLVAVSAASPEVAWASGARGTFVHTIDGGATWKSGQVPGAQALDFRDVHAIDANNALLLSAGNGDKSRIYRTSDAGATWTLQFTNTDSAGFYDCMDFFDARRGLVIGDEINGEVAILSTSDGGEHWTRIAAAGLPKALPNEGSFASSGTCLSARPNGHAWIATTKGRVLHTPDFGKSWTVSVAMTTANADSVGLTSVTFRDDKNGFAFGGFGARAGDTLVMITADGGSTWTSRPRPPNGAGVWGGSFVPGARVPTIVTVGPKGSAYSRDDGRTWTQIDAVNYWGIGFSSQGNRGWLVGAGGRITRLAGF